MSERLTLGYREAVAIGDSVLAAAGSRLRGHEFHRTVIEPKFFDSRLRLPNVSACAESLFLE